MKQLILWSFIFISNLAISQVTISGKLIDETDNPIVGASVVISQIGTDIIIAYSISDNKGKYSINFTSDEKVIDIHIRCIGFFSFSKTLSNKTQTQNCQLTNKVVELKEVVVKGSSITKRGDTINYTVSSFAKEQDRTIADVLKRMPGIEVLSDGKVLYQGKPINKYYIEGLDLLEGKYNLANENLPHNEVSTVQILENHQPVKILDSLQFSDNAALNIKLKNDYTFTGQAEVGSGFSPLLWDVNITPLLFTKKLQMLVAYQANNIGDNVGIQLKTLTFEDFLEQFENDDKKKDWLNIQQLSPPNFSEKRWIDNNIHLLTGNYLHKLKKDYEIRLNISYLNDCQKQDGLTYTQYFTPIDTISLLENKYNQLFTNSLETNLTLLKNTTKNYLKNSLQFQGFWDSQRGSILSNQEPLTQNLNNQYFKLSNKLKSIFPIGKQLITLNSYIGFNQTPQILNVNPGQFQELLNNGNEYDETRQEIDLNTFYTNNSIGLTKVWKQFSFNPKGGLQFEKQKLESEITTSGNQNLENLFRNNLDWIRTKLYFDVQTQYKKNKWRLELNTPINFHSYHIEDKPLQEGQDLSRLTFEPRFTIIYDANAFWTFSTSAGISNQFGTINQLHYAYILLNYRNIQRINTPLPQVFSQTFSGGISYQNPIKSVFWNVIYIQTNSENNLLYQSQILENGATELEAIEQVNNRINHNITTRLSKNFSTINTNTTINANVGLQDFQQIINNRITNIQNQKWGIGGKIETDFTDWFSIEYQARWTFSKIKIQRQSNNTIMQQNHVLNLNFFTTENHFFVIKTEYIKNNLFSEKTKNLFTDLLYRYTWKKKNIDFELQYNNIFNTKNYRSVNVDAFSYIETSFQLRPSQVLLKIRFSL